ncbi:hypothetical protein [Gallionella capsiferriformans]|nr:hypothetical protein [Gallionella capsiferriformans]
MADFDRQHGNFYIDEDVLRHAGMCDFASYGVSPGAVLYRDLFLDE